jgi:histidinol-phosphatase
VLTKELGFANELADRAADIALPLFHGDFEVRQKADRTPVTDADERIERMVRNAVSERFPDDAVLGEEGGLDGAADAERMWIVDPIDGTKNFTRGIQVWATLLALRVAGRIELGLVAAPALSERYEAVRGSGAFLNGAAIHVSPTTSLDDAHVIFSGLSSWHDREQRAFLDVVAHAGRTRAFGDFWAHALVARGSGEAALEPSLRLWDYAALVPIVEEAGGRVSSLDGGPLVDHGGVLTTNGGVHDAIAQRFATS